MKNKRGSRIRSGYKVRSGVAVIGVNGPTSYADIRRGLDTAMADDAVRNIVLDVDCPGGNVGNCGRSSAYLLG